MLAGSTGDAAQNSEAFERLTACLPHTGGTIVLNGFYNTKYGAIVPPRVTLMGAGMDSCGLVKTGNDIKTVPDRMWQGTPHSFSKDFIAAVDMDSDTTGNLDGNQTRSTRIIGLSLLCTAPNPSEFGIYSAISYDVRLEDLYIHNVNTGYRTSDSWLQVWSNITIKDVATGVKVDVGGTTYNMINVYVRNVSLVAYDLKNITYSSMTCCAADFINGIAYKLVDVTSLVMSGCGCESVTGSQWDFSGSRVDISSFRSVNIHDAGSETLKINGSVINLSASYLPGYVDSSTSKYVYINNSTINRYNADIPDHASGKFSWGDDQSTMNIIQYNGVFSVFGTSSGAYIGTIISGVYNIISSVPPDSTVTGLPSGSRWSLINPGVGTYIWVYTGGSWHAAGSVL